MQDAFLRAWRFRSSPPDGADVRPWLYRVVVNACLSRLRKDETRRNQVDHDDHALDGLPDVGRTPAEAAEHADAGVARLVAAAGPTLLVLICLVLLLVTARVGYRLTRRRLV